MLEPPAISDAAIVACLHSDFGLRDVTLEFLPLGADLRTAVYRATAVDASLYFVKLRFGEFDDVSALLPRWLLEQGIGQVMAPLPALSGRPWVATGEFTLLLYPLVEGKEAYGAVLSDEQWIAFGHAMRRIHDAALPAELADRLPQERYDPFWREQLRRFILSLDSVAAADRAGRRLAAFLVERRTEVLDLVDRTGSLAQVLQAEQPPFVVCHTDLHAGNLLVSEDGGLFIVDWDAPMLASRERDLMYPGGGQGFIGRGPDEEEALFYEGYGAAKIDLRALAYYRLERIIEDLAIFAQQLFGPFDGVTGGTEADREQALRWAMSNFEPGNVLEIAYKTAARVQN